MELFTLVAKLLLDKQEFDKGVEESSEKASSFGEKLKAGLGTGAKLAGAGLAAATGAAVATGKAILDGAGQIASYGDNIDKMSQKLGMSAEAYQEWDAILQHSGASIESMQGGMKALAAAVETGSDAFAELGMNTDDLKSLSQEELFSETIKALQGVEDETKRTYLASKLLGRGGTELGALLNTSAEDVEEMRQRVHELGGVMSDESVKAAAAYQDSLQDMTTAMDGMKRGFIAEFLPSITTVMDGLTELFAGNNGEGIAKINEGLHQFIDNMSAMIPDIVNVGTELILGLADAIIDNLPMIIDAGFQIIGKLVMAILEHLPEILTAGYQIILTLGQSISDLLNDVLTMGADVLASFVGGIIQHLSEVFNAGAQMVDEIKSSIMQKVEDAKNWGRDLISNFVGGITAKWEALKSTVSGIAQTVANFLGFSEPKEGPLSNFHTYAPDMMDLFMKGIKDNEGKLKDQLETTFDIGKNVTVEPSQANDGFAGLINAMRADINLLGEQFAGMQIVLDTGAMVGGLSDGMDKQLGINSRNYSRGI